MILMETKIIFIYFLCNLFVYFPLVEAISTAGFVQGGYGGCSYNTDSELYRASYASHNPASTWSWQLSGEQTVPDRVNWPNYKWMPDGHLSTVKHPRTGEWIIFYPNSASYRSIGPVPLPERSTSLSPGGAVIGGKKNYDAYNNGGMWLMSAHLTDPRGSMIGFVHAEDQFYPANGAEAYKSVALACSEDFGASWREIGRILTVDQKPGSPAWSGRGDMDVVWDWKNQRWVMVTGGLSAAASYDKSGQQSSWKKWDGSGFTRSSLVEPLEPLRDTNGHTLPKGANPSVHWNTYLQLWVMVYHGWNGNIYITSARDLPYFDAPRVLVTHSGYEKNWYPTLISMGTGDRVGARKLHLYYRHFGNFNVPGKQSSFKKAIIDLSRD